MCSDKICYSNVWSHSELAMCDVTVSLVQGNSEYSD